jgi:predicted amidohydrolase YtcJ
MKVLYRGGTVYSPADPKATALLVDGAAVAWLGPDAEAPAADRTVELDGGLVTPAFVDAHVHATDTGILLHGLDLTGTRSRDDVLAQVTAQVTAQAGGGDGVVLGHGWDESGWAEQQPPTADELVVAGGGRPVYLTRVDMHSAIVSADLLAGAVAAPGYDPSGWLRRDAHHVARRSALGSVSAAQRRAAQSAALRHAASLGIAAVHECGGPGISSEDDFTALLALSAEGGLPKVYGYWGELGAPAKARELGAVGAGGDLFADGALGSHTAHLRQSYVDLEDGGCGYGYLSAEEVTAHLVGCADHGVQGGFHAIGDAAIAAVLAGFAGAAKRVGVERLRAGRHRIEHVELLDKQLIAGLVEYGIVASMQPAFDRLWGGPAGMYAQRLGAARSLAANPFSALAGVGVSLAFGSDSPVTPLDPWGTVRAATRHHNPAQRISVRAAFAAHTRGGWRAVRRDADGVLVPGAPATFVVWDVPGELRDGLPVLDGDLPVARQTVLDGNSIHEAQ